MSKHIKINTNSNSIIILIYKSYFEIQTNAQVIAFNHKYINPANLMKFRCVDLSKMS